MCDSVVGWTWSRAASAVIFLMIFQAKCVALRDEKIILSDNAKGWWVDNSRNFGHRDRDRSLRLWWSNEGRSNDG